MRRHSLIPGLLLSCILALALAACNSGKEKPEVVATVNGAPIDAEELQKEVARFARQNPSQKITGATVEDRLKVIIEQKLLVQEAMKKRLHEDKKFVAAIKQYWEQALIKELIESETSERAETLFVTDEEIKEEYDRMGCRPSVVAMRARTQEDADKIVNLMRAGKTPDGAEASGPLYYDDAKGCSLSKAFEMEAGEVKAFFSEGEYVVIHLLKKDKVPIPPMDDIRSLIKESLLAHKKQTAVKKWMEKVKQSARIKINDKMLQRIAHE
ncbi:MAG: hypothetical protein JW943_04120 [Deltaproteobacteria bacterium]|nr:hypothetical protein [Deltaproteobacteria bacterium]